MRTVAHLSDLHFGRINESILPPLIAQLRTIRPDLVAISGDLTQRAREREFQQARELLDALPQPQIVVPGNHDIPLHNVYARFRAALEAYQRYISPDLEPFYTDHEIAVIGANTARSLAWKGGRINREQVERIEERMHSLGPEIIKVLVTHHPFDLPVSYRARHLAGRAPMAISRLVSGGLDLLLAGHIHMTHAGHTTQRYQAAGRSAVFVQAGTLSVRGRGEPNSFNVVRIDRSQIEVNQLSWQPEISAFAVASTELFQHTVAGWVSK